MGRITDTVKHIIIINVLLWIGTILVGTNGDIFTRLFAMHFPFNNDFQVWQVLTHMFMHASYTEGGSLVFYHLLFNMFGVWMFGTPLEQMWGKKKFIFFYISSGLGSLLLYSGILYFQFMGPFNELVAAGFTKTEIMEVLNSGYLTYDRRWEDVIGIDGVRSLIQPFNTTMLGASGALYGILVAFAISFPNTSLMLIFLPIPIKAKYFVPALLAMDLFFGLTSYSIGPIAHFAHIGGALTGFIMAWFWKKNSFNSHRWN
ncbi:MAG: rhomboid family intramembrane serine protease [Flavobacteriaceae bacterium]|nr:rhomboid family intramembrane serine protease [Flavobacteriaceae bacterium]